MKSYELLGKKIIINGIKENTRVGPARALHNETLSFDLKEGFPLMTTKHVGHKSIIHETLWYLKGGTSIKYLKENNVHVWDKFADENDDIGKTYPYQFRNFSSKHRDVDQVFEVIKQLNKDDGTTSRRAIINLYHAAELDQMSIPPCVALIQFNAYYVNGEKILDASIYQRSADFCLGVPYDIAEMALLTHIIAAYTNSTPNNMTIFYSNIHIYEAHVDTLITQLAESKPGKLPTLWVDIATVRNTAVEDLTVDMFKFTGIPAGRRKYYYELF